MNNQDSETTPTGNNRKNTISIIACTVSLLLLLAKSKIVNPQTLILGSSKNCENGLIKKSSNP
jgi:hypothetical protein